MIAYEIKMFLNRSFQLNVTLKPHPTQELGTLEQ